MRVALVVTSLYPATLATPLQASVMITKEDRKKKPARRPGRPRGTGGGTPRRSSAQPDVRAILAERISEWSQQLTATLPLELAAEALSRASTREALVHVLSQVASLETEPELQRKRREAQERFLVWREQMTELAGGLLSTEDVAERLSLTRQAVDKRRRLGRLLALQSPSGFRFPACQFTRTGVVPHLEEVLAALGEHGLDFWEILAALVLPVEALGDRTVLTEGR